MTLSQIVEMYNSTHAWKHWPVMHSAMMFEELPAAIENRQKRLHEQRLDVSRIMMRSGLPSDLVPTICAYAVPASKIYDYMK